MKISAIIVLTLISSCVMDRKPPFSEITGENYTIQVMSLPTHSDDNGREYKVRVLPGQKVLDEYGKQLQELLWYQTGDCFYITQGNTDIKPELVQPIATGVVNCYEFMLVFDGLSVSENNEITLVFNDRHITGEKYLIKSIRNL